MKNKNSILLICVYMGKLPFWMPAFLVSCEYNQDINWFIVSNQSIPGEIPANVEFVNMSIRDFNILASDTLNFNVDIKSDYAYKINDIKVAYGEMFAEQIKKFVFWGYCDIDVVWGNIRKFITKEILDEYDVITSRVKRISGHFCLFKNRKEINELYRGIENIEEMMQDSVNHAIDENITDYYMQIIKPNWFHRVIFYYRLKNSRHPKLKIYWNKVLTTSGAHQRALGEGIANSFLWKEGKTFSADRKNEFMYIHFHKMKQSMDTIDFSYRDMPSSFIINRKGFFAKN